jgi:phosphate acetyltransferase
MTDTDYIENVTFAEISMGQSARVLRTLTLEDIQAFAAICGDPSPTPPDYDASSALPSEGMAAHGMWGGALIFGLLGNQFPGAGIVYLDQVLHFVKPVHVGDTLVVTATVTGMVAAQKRVEFDCTVVNQHGELVLRGTAGVRAPVEKLRTPRISAAQIQRFDPEAHFKDLLSKGAGLQAVRCAVVHPCDKESLSGALDSARYGLIVPVLVGPEQRIRKVAEENGLDLRGIELVNVAHSHEAAARSADMAARGDVEILMKGSLHTDELITAVLDCPALRTGRRMSHVFRFDVPLYPKPLLITDAALNIFPTLKEKVDIIQNAIDFARILGVAVPKVAILSAVEMVNPGIPSTVDAAALCKMAERGQIKGGILDGPLAFDNAISLNAARIKSIVSLVSGDADILVVPDLESGNMLAKQLEYLAGASSSGLVLGARVPIALTSRSDGPMSRVASALLAKLAAHDARNHFPR